MNNLIPRLHMIELLMCVKMTTTEVTYLISNETDNIIWALSLKLDLQLCKIFCLLFIKEGETSACTVNQILFACEK